MKIDIFANLLRITSIFRRIEFSRLNKVRGLRTLEVDDGWILHSPTVQLSVYDNFFV